MCNGVIEACHGFDGRHRAEVTGHPKRPPSPQGGEVVHRDHPGGELRSLIRELLTKGEKPWASIADLRHGPSQRRGRGRLLEFEGQYILIGWRV